jgi:hypothetical protein
MASNVPHPPAPCLDVTVEIHAPATAVVHAFFDPEALGAWWKTIRSVTTPRLLGAFALEWAPTETRDQLLGRLGGTFRGTVMQFDHVAGFFVADAFWLPPDGGPIGPMALDVLCEPSPGGRDSRTTKVRVTLNGFDESVRWRRFYDVVGAEWKSALVSLKALLEESGPPR